MKATFEAVQTNNWKRVNARHFLVAAGGTLVAVAAIIGLNVRSEGTPPASQSQVAGPTQILSKSQPQDLLVYIVGSQAEKEELDRSGTFLEWFSEPGTAGLSTISMRTVLVEPGTEESLGLLSELLPEAGMTTGHGAKLTLYDMR
jgi:hypothetical protein